MSDNQELTVRLASIQEAAKRRNAQKQRTEEEVQLTFWPDPVRGVPNSILRGALFAAIQGKSRRALQRELLAVQQDIEIRFTGIQLDQSDLDVWEQALHLARKHPLGTRCDFTARAFLKALGRSTGKTNYEWLKNVLARLSGCSVEITHNRLTYSGSLLEFWRDEDTQWYRLEINPRIKALYDAGFTQIDWEQRQKLRRKPLALWLHGFLASHARPYPLKVETLWKLSGGGTRRLEHFRDNLQAALEELKGVGAIEAYDITDQLVTVASNPSRSQKKHLKRTKPRR